MGILYDTRGQTGSFFGLLFTHIYWPPRVCKVINITDSRDIAYTHPQDHIFS